MAKKRTGGHPPAEHQFKPGQSGNPGGRPKGRRSLREVLLQRLERLIWVTIDGERKQVPLAEALMDKHLTAAETADFLQFLKWAEGAAPPPQPAEVRTEAPAEEDVSILAAAFEREVQRRVMTQDGDRDD